MPQLLEVLKKIIDEMKKENPYELVFKGGTSLSLFHLNNHRDSEDLDFDCDLKYKERAEDILAYINGIFGKLQKENIIADYKINKAEFSAKERYHISLEIATHKKYLSKIDIDFKDIEKNDIEKKKLLNEGKLFLYSKEHMLVSKLLTFKSRRNLKDLYDIFFLLKYADRAYFRRNAKVANLLSEIIESMKLKKEELVKLYKQAFKNADMHFAYLKEKDITLFYEKTISELNIFKNMILK